MYDYQTIRPFVFSEEGQVTFLKVRDRAKALMLSRGMATTEEIISGCGGGDTWQQVACVDRLVELGELLAVPNPHAPSLNHRIHLPANSFRR